MAHLSVVLVHNFYLLADVRLKTHQVSLNNEHHDQRNHNHFICWANENGKI